MICRRRDLCTSSRRFSLVLDDVGVFAGDPPFFPRLGGIKTPDSVTLIECTHIQFGQGNTDGKRQIFDGSLSNTTPLLLYLTECEQSF